MLVLQETSPLTIKTKIDFFLSRLNSVTCLFKLLYVMARLMHLSDKFVCSSNFKKTANSGLTL